MSDWNAILGGEEAPTPGALAPQVEQADRGEPAEPAAVEPTAATDAEERAIVQAPPGVAAVSVAERALMVSVMRVAPDVRYRAARSLGLFEGLEGRQGVELERALLANAHSAGRLQELDEALAR